jgi:transporter family protein
MWMLYAFLSALTAALVAIFAKAGLNRIDSTLATTLRSIIMAVFLVAFAFIGGKYSNLKHASISMTEWLLLACAGIAGALSWLFYFVAIRNGNVSAVVAIDRLSLVFVVFFAAMFFKESITWRTGLGVILMVSGALLIGLRPNIRNVFIKN